jgi:ABC-type bacteriocin/lantibiotic exporter with double-glycine peptidase domain
MKELFLFFKEFYLDNKKIVLITILLRTLSSIFITNIIPYILSKLFININDKNILKRQLIILVGVWLTSRIIYSISLHYRTIFETKLIEYIMTRIITSCLIKYEFEHEISNVAILLDRTMAVKNSLEDAIDLITIIFIPRILAIFISCIQLFIISVHLGSVVFICIISQYFIYIFNNDKCISKGIDEYEKKDKLYNYVEEIFNNINIIQSTNNSYNIEIKNIKKIVDKYGESKEKNSRCISTRQNIGYFSNVVIFSIIVYTLYILNVKKKINNEKTLTSILLVIGLFDNLNDFTFNIPEMMRKIAQLKNLTPFMQDILKYKKFKSDNSIKLTNCNINFDNVTFGYSKDNMIFQNLTIKISEKNIITIFGQSGSGKSTFIKLIFGILKPNSGNITIGNVNYHKFEYLRKYISYIEQNTNNLFNKTILENIIYGYEYNENEKEILRNKVKNIIDKFDLYVIFSSLDKNKKKWDFLNEGVGKYGEKLSGGQKKIIYLLKLYLCETSKLIILDEPTNGLDNITKNKIINFFLELKNIGKTLLIISHDNDIKKLGDKILKFDNNKNPEYI